ncbi:hypothetical protein A8H32_30865 [Burkholderia thailandensis]|nr:hypothetical protein A8H32_30865 [Burkholderia thailandensis]
MAFRSRHNSDDEAQSDTRPAVVGDDAGEDREDRELTACPGALIVALLPESPAPRLCCPRCSGGPVTSAGFRTRTIGRLPMFGCRTCQRYFGCTVDGQGQRVWRAAALPRHFRPWRLFFAMSATGPCRRSFCRQ